MNKPKSKGKVRAFTSNDAYRLNGDVPLIVDKTELITPEVAEKMLKKNKYNRPVSWAKVEQYRKLMENGEWKFHAQGLILDEVGNILTGQKRLWAVIYSGTSQYFRVSRGTPKDMADLIDRGTPQSSRDLAARKTERKHSPTEASIVRCLYAIDGKLRPSVDDMANKMIDETETLERVMKESRGIRKTRPVIMIMAAICHIVNKTNNPENYVLLAALDEIVADLADEIKPIELKDCWNKGAAFSLAMKKAVEVCEKALD